VRELLGCGCNDGCLEGFEGGGCCGGVAEVIEEGEAGVHGSSFSLAAWVVLNPQGLLILVSTGCIR